MNEEKDIKSVYFSSCKLIFSDVIPEKKSSFQGNINTFENIIYFLNDNYSKYIEFNLEYGDIYGDIYIPAQRVDIKSDGIYFYNNIKEDS
jgi:hypothetical protein